MVTFDIEDGMYIHSYSKSTPGIYFDENFLAFLEQHLSYIKAHGLSNVELTSTNSYKHEGNFYGILNEINVPVIYHYICLRVNNLRHSDEFDGIDTIIHLPDFELIEVLKNQYLTLAA